MTIFRKGWVNNKREDCKHQLRASQNDANYVECINCGVMVEKDMALEHLLITVETLEERLAKLEARIAAR